MQLKQDIYVQDKVFLSNISVFALEGTICSSLSEILPNKYVS
jgi:hypothetical protein